MTDMARIPNPYRPGFNQAPTSLAGREVALAAVAEALAVAALDGRTLRPIVFVGSRGVGKTVLLGESAAIADERHSWLTVPIEVRPGRDFTPQLIERLSAARDVYQQVEPGQRLQVTAAKVRADAHRREWSAPPPTLSLGRRAPREGHPGGRRATTGR